MIKLLKYIASIALLFNSMAAFSQNGNEWLENTMFQSGKINVVVAVILIFIIILFIYLFSIDRKLKKLEEENN